MRPIEALRNTYPPGRVFAGLLMTLLTCAVPAFPQDTGDDRGGSAYPPELRAVAGGSSRRILPADEELGALTDLRVYSPGERRVLERSMRFIETLGEGRIASELLEEQVRDAVMLSLHDGIQAASSIREVRYGRIELRSRSGDGRSARVPLRLFSEEGETNGELFLWWDGENWYISSVQLDLQDL
jgi:hypothetical protein